MAHHATPSLVLHHHKYQETLLVEACEEKTVSPHSDLTLLFTRHYSSPLQEDIFYGIILYRSSKFFSYSARTKKLKAVFSAFSVAPCYHPSLDV